MKFLVSFSQRRNFFTTARCLHTAHASPLRFISSSCFYGVLGSCKDIESLHKVHALLVVNGLTGNLQVDTKLVSLYGSFGKVSVARMVFDEMPHPDFYSWKVMLRWYALNRSYLEIIPFYISMRLCVPEHDDVVLSIMLKACSELQDINQGRKVHSHVIKDGTSDSVVFSGLVDMYGKCGEIECSRQAFDEITDKNVVSWTSIISGYVQNDCMEEGLVLFNRMREEATVKLNEFTLGSLITACTRLGALHQGKWVHGYVIKTGTEVSPFLVTSLLDFYVKCAQVDDARALFELSAVNLVSWTAMIVGYTQNCYPDMALRLFIDKISEGVLFPNSITIPSVLSACAQLGCRNIGKSVHGLTVKLGLEESAAKNGLIEMYSKCEIMEDASRIFELVDKNNVVAWSTMMSGFLQNGSPDKAIDLFHRMRSKSVSPDAVTVVTVLSASSLVGAYRVGLSLHGYSIKQGLLSSNVYIGTTLLNFYAKCGDTGSARIIFDAMDIKNTITWSAMIGGYGIQGDGLSSVSLFTDMINKNLNPNEVVFTTILSACGRTGMVGEGWKYFNSMCKDYKLVPKMKHYGCMVDMLSRAGRLEEAMEFLEKMPVEPELSLFGAFLHGCGLYSRFDLGEVAIKKMMGLHPGEPCYYVLISNLYASDGRWSRVDGVRELMERRGLRKWPAYSAVDDFSLARAAIEP